ncbi:hypothetical protein SAMN02745163_03559 [Clostridium cavendishii DSM 21758]|uniref:ABC-2 family transporter protein n=1 Tax=Clostridium cavendishii DSM 21758 TaxID=1121302 RepID=A0A1M6R6X9_9CLOT|nr:hypothetical protein [Clostridium cavendishii]SHK28239.1 hypothetical protein SAMN02745163_03559 [Clostridium cavendishii DSM 21758]
MNNKEREIKEMLNKYSVPSYDKDAPMKVIEFIHENSLSIPKFRTSNKQFVISQIGFIRKRTWALQLIILGFLCLGFYNVGTGDVLNFRTFSLMSILAPLLLIINVEEISRIYNKSMLEIEFSTRNSIKKVLVTRMLILGVVDCILLIIMMIFAGNLTNVSILRVIMYTLVPFNFVCIGFMKLMNYFKGKELNYACMAYSVLLIAVLLFARVDDLGIYTQEFITGWILIYVVTTIMFSVEVKKVIRRLENFDDVIKEAII